MRLILAVVVGSLLALGCQTSSCPPRGGTEDGGCVDRWVCPGAFGEVTYEVRCTPREPDAGRECSCLRNGQAERSAQPEPWCHVGTPDAYERIIDANKQCGWSIPFGG